MSQRLAVSFELRDSGFLGAYLLAPGLRCESADEQEEVRVLQNLDEDDDPIEPETDAPTIVRVDCTERPDEVIQALAGAGLELVSREEWT